MKKRIMALLLMLCMVLSLAPAAFAASDNSFTDVSSTDWYYDEVMYAYENDLMKGTSTTTFSPDATTSRAMIVTILYRLEDEPAVSAVETFTDVTAGQYYAEAVEWAAANSIVGGYGNGLFGPNELLTREQMAAILYRYADYKGYDISGAADLSGYSDAASISAYALAAMQWANYNGLVNGTSATTLSPAGAATRAQFAVILYRFCETVAADPSYAEEYTVTFEYNYGSAGTYKVVTVDEGETVDQPSNPTRSSYSFSGWYTKASGGSKFDFDTEITADLTLYAHWSYNGGGGDSGHSHTYGAWVSNDDGTHTRPSTCGHSAQTEPCIYVGDVCSICGYDSTAVAKINDNYYTTFEAAKDAVQNGETITILEGTCIDVLDVTGGKTFTVMAKKTGTVIIAGINQQANGDAASTVTFKNLTIDNSKATAGWFTGTAQNIFPCVGAWGGNLSFENCTFEVAGDSKKETGVMTWWTTNKVILSFNGCTFNGIGNNKSARAMQIYGNVDMTVTGCTFNTAKDYSLKYVANEGNVATFTGNIVNNTENFVELGSSTYPGSKYTVKIDDTTLGEYVNRYVIANPENQIVYVDGAQAITSADELAAALTADAETINVALYNDIDLPITSLGSITPSSGEYKLGGENTTAVTIDLNGNKLNITTDYWSAIGCKNADATITVKNGSMVSTRNSAATWNANDLRFSNCNWEFECVVFDKEVALDNAGKSTTMKSVTINGTGDYYALWITAEGQTVNIDTLTVNTSGRGIKIDAEYIDSPTKVSLSVKNAEFNTAAKAAVLVDSSAGADITLSNVDISGVAADPYNEVWVDEDAMDYADYVTVNGGTKIVEGAVNGSIRLWGKLDYTTGTNGGIDQATVTVYNADQLQYALENESTIYAAVMKEAGISSETLLYTQRWCLKLGANIDFEMDKNSDPIAPFEWKFGSIDGGNYSIRNVYITSSDPSAKVGLFDDLVNATVSDLNLENIHVTASGENAYVGTLTGSSQGECTNVSVDRFSVTASGENAYAGGLFASSYGSKTNCSVSNGSITAGSSSVTVKNVGGFAGYICVEDEGATTALSGCSVSNVIIDAYNGSDRTTIGSFVGRLNQIDGSLTLTTCTIDNVTVNNVSSGDFYGDVANGSVSINGDIVTAKEN